MTALQESEIIPGMLFSRQMMEAEAVRLSHYSILKASACIMVLHTVHMAYPMYLGDSSTHLSKNQERNHIYPGNGFQGYTPKMIIHRSSGHLPKYRDFNILTI
jgi:hypothetical protein